VSLVLRLSTICLHMLLNVGMLGVSVVLGGWSIKKDMVDEANKLPCRLLETGELG
jgi:hypothetical protein